MTEDTCASKVQLVAIMKPVYLLTGNPGTGKTTLIKQVVAESQITAGGFYTEEIRNEGTRLGFKLVTMDGQEAILAHTDFNKQFQVGKYGVNVSAMDSVGVPALREAAERCDLVVIDEIGKMELLSSDFRAAVREIIGSGKRVLGTITLHANPWTDAIKRQPQINLVTLTRANFPQVLEDLRNWLRVSPDHAL